MSQPISTQDTIDSDTLKKRPSGEIYVDPSVIVATGVASIAGTWALNSVGLLTTVDTATSTVYKLTVESGVVTLVEV